MSKLNEASVLAVGPGKRDNDGKLIPMGVAVGDKVLLPQYGGNEVKLDDEEVMLIKNEIVQLDPEHDTPQVRARARVRVRIRIRIS